MGQPVALARILEEAQHEIALSRECTARRAALGFCSVSVPGRPRVLVVEDEVRLADLYEQWIDALGLGAVVVRAASLKEGLESLGWLDIRAAVVDWRLGNENARPLVVALLARGIPTKIVSGAEPETTGLDVELWQKPIPRDKFKVWIREALANSAVTQPLAFEHETEPLEGALCPKCGRHRLVLERVARLGRLEREVYAGCQRCEPGERIVVDYPDHQPLPEVG